LRYSYFHSLLNLKSSLLLLCFLIFTGCSSIKKQIVEYIHDENEDAFVPPEHAIRWCSALCYGEDRISAILDIEDPISIDCECSNGRIFRVGMTLERRGLR